MSGSEGWIAFGKPEVAEKRGFFFSKLGFAPTDGRLAARACPQCARVLLYAVHKPEAKP